MGERSVLLAQLVTAGAQVALALVLARVALAALLVLVARGLRGGPASAAVTRAALVAAPAFARRAVVRAVGAGAVLGLTATGLAATGAVAASPRMSAPPPAPLLDRVVTAVLDGGPLEWRDPPAPHGTAHPAPTRRSASTHVVRSGESLWSIAAHAAGPEATRRDIARAWPRWYARNRAVVGPDPDRIVPGQRLVAPRDG